MLGMEAAPPAPAQDVRAFEGYVKWERLQEDAKLPRHDTTRPQARHGHRCVLVDSKRGAERGIPGGPQMLSIFGGDRGLMGDFWAYGIGECFFRASAGGY